jgi:hypothetical protein
MLEEYRRKSIPKGQLIYKDIIRKEGTGNLSQYEVQLQDLSSKIFGRQQMLECCQLTFLLQSFEGRNNTYMINFYFLNRRASRN